MPSQGSEFLGFKINSQKMIVSLMGEKIENFTTMAKQLLTINRPRIREVAAVIGLMVAYTLGVEFGAAHYRYLEIDQIKALRKNKGYFDREM